MVCEDVRHWKSKSGALNVAVTEVLLLRVKLQEPVPLHPPLKVPVPGVVVRVIEAPGAKLALHVPLEQFIPAGELLTEPVPLMVTLKELQVGGQPTPVVEEVDVPEGVIP